MKILAVTSGDNIKSEIPIVMEMFREGLDVLHLRKPNFSEHLVEEYLSLLPEIYHNRIVLHGYHDLAKKFNLKGIHITKRHKKTPLKTWWRIRLLKWKKPTLKISTSCHSLSKLKKYTRNYDYVFLSPVFNSISKKHRKAGFSHKKIKKKLLSLDNVYAMGGVNAKNIERVKELGFDGVVLYGSLWKDGSDPVAVFKEIKAALQNRIEPAAVTN